MNPKHDHDFTQFQGAFDLSQVPDPTFAETLRRRMAAEGADAPLQRTSILTSPQTSPGKPQERRVATMPPASRRPLWIAVAALLVVAIIGASVWRVGGLVDEGQYGAVPEVVLPVDASVVPKPDVVVTSRDVPGTDGLFLFESTDDAVTLIAIPSTDAGPNMVAWDSRGREQIWEMRVPELRQVITHGSTRYALKAGTTDTSQWEYGVPPTDLAAYDAESGAEIWVTTLPTSNNMSYWGSMAVSEGTVVITGTQAIIAIDTDSGAVIWQRQFSDIGIERYGEVSRLDPVIVNDRIALIEESGALRVLDIASGELVAESVVFDVSGANVVSFARAFASPYGLLTMIVYATGGQSYTDFVLLDDSLTTTVWSRQVKGFSVVDVSQQGDIAIVKRTYKSYPGFLKVIGLRSHTNMNVIWVDGSSGKDILSIESTTVSDSHAISVTTNGTYACFTAEETFCVDRNGTMYLIDVVLDNRLAIYTDMYTAISGNTLWVQTEHGVKVFDLP